MIDQIKTRPRVWERIGDPPDDHEDGSRWPLLVALIFGAFVCAEVLAVLLWLIVFKGA